MNSTPTIVQHHSQLAACLGVKVERKRIQQVMGPGIQEAMAAVAAQGIGPDGAWFAHHHRITAEEFDFDICVPVSAPLRPVGRVRPGLWPAMTVARTVYTGPYEGLGAAWAEFDHWLANQPRRCANDLWERYLAGPESIADPALYRTELNRQLLD